MATSHGPCRTTSLSPDRSGSFDDSTCPPPLGITPAAPRSAPPRRGRERRLTMATPTRSPGIQTLTWKKGLLVPRRFDLSATAGRSGALAFRSLYRPRRLRARIATTISLFAMTHGIGRASADPGDEARELCE